MCFVNKDLEKTPSKVEYFQCCCDDPICTKIKSGHQIHLSSYSTWDVVGINFLMALRKVQFTRNSGKFKKVQTFFGPNIPINTVKGFLSVFLEL